jgi:integrase
MPSIHKDPRGRSPNWYCAYTDMNGVRHFRSTKTGDKKSAQQVCNTWAKAAMLGARLTPEKARDVIAAGVADIMLASGQELPTASIEEWIDQWLNAKELEAEASTHSRYSGILKRFVKFVGKKAQNDLATLQPKDITKFRDHVAKILSVASANLSLKVLRAWLNSAVKHDLIAKNVASTVPVLKSRGQSKRRAFTQDEVVKVLKQCEQAGGEWTGFVLAAAYTGQRLGDIASLKWHQVDLRTNEISFVAQKTGNRTSLAIAEPLSRHLERIPSSDNPDSYVFPKAAELANKRSGMISNHFHDEILVPAGLAVKRGHKKTDTGKGRDSKRSINEVSFHSFRHTLTTWLKNAGASNAMAQMIIGHDSEVVSRGYTHLSAEDTKLAISKLPDITKPKKEAGKKRPRKKR